MSIKRTYRVTITKVVEVELPESFNDPQMIQEWCKSLWYIDSVDDIAQYAAKSAAEGCGGYELDGLGLLGESHQEWPRKPDVIYDITYEDIECEIE